MILQDIYLLGDAGDYFYISIQQPNLPSEHGFIRKSDLFDGNLDDIFEAEF